jgi:hypothetical protein
VRFIVTQSRYLTRATDIYLDGIAIEETPAAVTLSLPDQITTSSMRLSWNDPGAADFAAYAVYRSETSVVDTSSQLLTTITDPATTTFTDTGLQARRTYYYRVYLVDTHDVYSPSNTASAMTAAIGLPFTDDFETDSGAWTLTGDWGRQTAGGGGGSTGLTDSPADYDPSSDTWAVTGVDLSSTSWPVLSFTDQFDFGPGDWGRVEISDNGGSSWTTLYGANGSQPDWTGHTFDLSPWRTATQVWVRFRVTTDSGTPTSDGWHIDQVFIGENPLAGTGSYPFFSGGESGTTGWLDGPWGVTGDTPYEGSACFTTTDSPSRLGGAELRLVWGDEIDLSAETEPILSFQVRGDLPYRTRFRTEVSTDGGLTWQELPDLTGRLSWLQSTDPEEDNGDFVASYAVQVDDDPTFSSPEIDEPAIPARAARAEEALSVTLGSLTGSGSLVSGTRYYWRANAMDSHGLSSAWSAGPAYFVFGTDQQPPTCAITSPADGATLTSSPISITGTSTDDLSGTDLVELSTDGGSTWASAVGTDGWIYQWSPTAGADYQLSCRARDRSGNQGTASTPITVHVDLSRTVAFAVDGSWVDEAIGVANVTVMLSGPRPEPVTVHVTVTGGTAAAGTDYVSPAQTLTFSPGQTASVFQVTINDDLNPEPNETVILGLANPNPADITIGSVPMFTLHIVNDDSRADLDRDGQVTGNDMVVLLLEIFDLDGTLTPDVPAGTNPGWDGYDLDGDGRVLGSDVAEELKAFHE